MFSLVVALVAAACGPPDVLQRRVVFLSVPELPTPFVRRVDIPRRTTYEPVPLVVILDDGPPVAANRFRPQAARIEQLSTTIFDAGYAVWRPLKDAWPTDSLLVRCPDELAAQVRLGLLSARGLPFIDTSRVVVLGFGQGGVIGAMLARRTAGEIYALGLIGTPARAIDRIITTSPLRDSVTQSRMRRIFDDIRAGAYADTAAVLNGTAGCWRSWMAITDDMVGMVGRLSQPVLAVQGTADRLLPLLDIERFRRAIRNRPLSWTESAVGVKHDLSDEVPDPKEPPGIISPRVAPLVMRWLKTVAPLPGSK